MFSWILFVFLGSWLVYYTSLWWVQGISWRVRESQTSVSGSAECRGAARIDLVQRKHIFDFFWYFRIFRSSDPDFGWILTGRASTLYALCQARHPPIGLPDGRDLCLSWSCRNTAPTYFLEWWNRLKTTKTRRNSALQWNDIFLTQLVVFEAYTGSSLRIHTILTFEGKHFLIE